MTGQTTDAVRSVRSMWPATEPARWSLRRLRHLADIRPSNVDKKSVDGEANVRLCNYTDVYYNDSITSDMSFMPATAPLAQVKRFELRPDDVLVTKDSETPADIAIAAHVRDELPGVLCGYHLAILRPLPHVDGRFLVYALQSRPLAAQTEVAASGVTRFALSTGALADLTLPVPGRAEQLAIADFLDRETAKIDALVAKKQRLIGLLQEKRTALISRAVTKGLDPDVPMKDSGIEWLGDIPSHWELQPLGRHLHRITYGFTNPMPNADYGPYMLTANDIADGEILWSAARRTTGEAFVSELTDKSRPKAGDVLVTKDGSLGRAAVHDGRPACVNQSVAVLRPRASLSPRFLLNVLRATPYQSKMRFDAGGTTIKHIYVTRLAKMPVASPSQDEQSAIVQHIQKAQAQSAELVRAVAEAIERLDEYRSALITAAVTGQIEVGATTLTPAAK
jgi:type I restriction enzyme S subunit